MPRRRRARIRRALQQPAESAAKCCRKGTHGLPVHAHSVRILRRRRREDLPENFSIGLTFLPKDGTADVLLLRCNGPHGGFNASFDPDHPHWDFHVHRASAEMIEAGQRPEKSAAVNREFAS